jgi:hypothetical protein
MRVTGAWVKLHQDHQRWMNLKVAGLPSGGRKEVKTWVGSRSLTQNPLLRQNAADFTYSRKNRAGPD